MSDYGSQASIYFEFLDRKDKSFVLSDVCPLEILMMELSLDCKYLAVVCGSPTFRLLLVDVELQKIVSGAESSLDLRGNIDSLLRVDFNPGNRKTFSLLFTDTIEVYDIKDSFELGSDGVIAETISIFRRSVFQPTEGHFETMVWD